MTANVEDYVLKNAADAVKGKVLVIKRKVAKTSGLSELVVVVSVATGGGLDGKGVGVIGKAIGAKDARVASEDAITSKLGMPKDAVSPFQIQAPVEVVLDNALTKITTGIAFKAPNASEIITTGTNLIKYFKENLPDHHKIHDFSVVAEAPAASKPAVKSKPSKTNDKATPGLDEKEVKIGIEVKKEEDFAKWYQQVLVKGEMLEYYDVSGCYIVRPWAYYVWERVQSFFNEKIDGLGVENCAFPLFVSQRALEREKDHIEGFAPEVAWVTKAGTSDLAEPVAIRPTSETVLYPVYAKWIKSHRDLPLKLNQWNSVVRWEFKHPQPFIRSREFYWQEGHTAHATLEEASVEVRRILDYYAMIYEDLMAVPVVKGKKSEKEKFAGAYYTTTVEGYIPTTGRGIQGATSHCLGQNFSKMFEICYEDGDRLKSFAWQNSWGISTRSIGVMVMVHGDNKGLVMPPRCSRIQAVFVVCGITAKTTEEEKKTLTTKVEELAQTLRASGVRAKADLRENYTPGYKFNHWEMRGVPLRIELGPRDLAQSKIVLVERFSGSKSSCSMADMTTTVRAQLDDIHKRMLDGARAVRDAHLRVVDDWGSGFVSALDSKCLVLSPWCEAECCEEAIKKRSAEESSAKEQDEKAPSMGAKSLCIPFDAATLGGKSVKGKKCIACDRSAVSYTLFGRSY